MHPLSSSFLQTLLLLNKIFAVIYFFIIGCLFFYKGFGLYYPNSTMEVDVIILVILAICELVRLKSGSIGNKTESSAYLVWFLLIIIPSAIGFIYFLFIQTYVLVIEIIFNVIGIILIVLEFISALIALSTFKSFEKQQY